MTIEHYLATLYIVIGVLTFFHCYINDEDRSIPFSVFTGIIWPIFAIFSVIYNFVGEDS